MSEGFELRPFRPCRLVPPPHFLNRGYAYACHSTQVNALSLMLPLLVSWYSIYLPRRDGRLSCTRQCSAPAGKRSGKSDALTTEPPETTWLPTQPWCGMHTITHPEVLKQQFLSLRENYCGLPLSDDMSFDTELVSQVVGNLKRGKAPGMDGLLAEHLMFSHPILPVILSKLFRLILLTQYVRTGFKYSYLVPIPKPRNAL